jgi:hypothetical protein
MIAVLVGLIAAGAVTGAASAQESQDDGACGIWERWLASNPGGREGDPLTGVCPTEGDCDVPEVRDGFLPDEATPIRWLRLHFNVFCAADGSDCIVDDQGLIDQVAQLNADFMPWRIQFTHTYEFVNDDLYRYGPFEDDADMKEAYARDPHLQCNVYVVDPEQPWSWGFFPWWPGALDWQGGVVMKGLAVQRANNVLTHEIGHNLGLYHLHHGVDEVPDCSACYESPDDPDRDLVGDFCADTPPGPANRLDCEDPGTDDPCTGDPWGDTQRENHMSYAHRTCRWLFTPQQAARMHCWSDAMLLSWLDCAVGDDCNGNGVNDHCDIRDGTSHDTNGNGIPDECECREDIDDGGTVDTGDLILLLAAWGPCAGCPEDVNGDDTVDTGDLILVLAAWGPCE